MNDSKLSAAVQNIVGSLAKLEQKLPDYQTQDGISLLALKNDLLLRYIQSIAFLLLHKTSSLSASTSSSSDSAKLAQMIPQDLLDSLIVGRVTIDKIRSMQIKLNNTISRVIKAADDSATTSSGKKSSTKLRDEQQLLNDPMAFRAQPQNFKTVRTGEAPSFAASSSNKKEKDSDSDGSDAETNEKPALYRPPKLSAVAYPEPPTKAARYRPMPNALATDIELLNNAHAPVVTSNSGLSEHPTASAFSSSRAKELARMEQFEEDNFTRLIMSKAETKRRLQDEEDMAMGATRAAGMGDDFKSILRDIGQSGDRYDEVRAAGKKASAFERSKIGRDTGGGEEKRSLGTALKRKGRFEKDVKMREKRKKN